MDTRFWLGYALVVFGFVLLVWEVCYEPELLKRPQWIQISALAGCLGGLAAVTIYLINAYAPITIVSYSPRKGEYPNGTVIGGIEWNSHFADLRLALTNTTGDDYEKIDLSIRPDAWVYKAAFLTRPEGCDLTPLPGDTMSIATNVKGGHTIFTATKTGGGDVDLHDDKGDPLTTYATRGGYRLRCETFPSRYTIELVFSLVTPPSALTAQKQPLREAEFPGTESPFDVLEAKPNPQTMAIDGHYKRNKQPFSLNSAVSVADGS